MKAFVDKETCIGCELCTSICPKVFTMDTDGKSIATHMELENDIIDDAKEAESQCPIGAISVK